MPSINWTWVASPQCPATFENPYPAGGHWTTTETCPEGCTAVAPTGAPMDVCGPGSATTECSCDPDCECGPDEPSDPDPNCVGQICGNTVQLDYIEGSWDNWMGACSTAPCGVGTPLDNPNRAKQCYPSASYISAPSGSGSTEATCVCKCRDDEPELKYVLYTSSFADCGAGCLNAECVDSTSLETLQATASLGMAAVSAHGTCSECVAAAIAYFGSEYWSACQESTPNFGSCVVCIPPRQERSLGFADPENPGCYLCSDIYCIDTTDTEQYPHQFSSVEACCAWAAENSDPGCAGCNYSPTGIYSAPGLMPFLKPSPCVPEECDGNYATWIGQPKGEKNANGLYEVEWHLVEDCPGACCSNEPKEPSLISSTVFVNTECKCNCEES